MSFSPVYKKPLKIVLHQGDLAANTLDGVDALAVDTETMGLRLERDRLCLVQLSAGDGICHLVQIREKTRPDRLIRRLGDTAITKIFHFARFDLAAIYHGLGVSCYPVYCTRTASKLIRTYTDRHGLRELCRELLGVDISKQQQSSDWGADTLSDAQRAYAARDVLHLHHLRAILDTMLEREGRSALARSCFDVLPTLSQLDLGGWRDMDIFSHG